MLAYNGLCLSLFSGFIISVLSVLYRPSLIEKIFSLISVFVCLSFFLILHGFDFLPLVILLLYVGSIAVLFLFVVIILNPDIYNTREKAYIKRNQEYNQRKYQQQVESLKEQKIDQAKFTFFLTIKPFYTAVARNVDAILSQVGFLFISQILPIVGKFRQKRYPFKKNDVYPLVIEGLFALIFAIIIFTGWYCALRFINCVALRQSMPMYLTPMIYHDTEVSGYTNLLAVTHAQNLAEIVKLPRTKSSTDLIEIGHLLYKDAFGYALLIVGLILLVSIIGVILLTIKRQIKIRLKTQSVTDQAVRYRTYFKI